MIRWLSAPAVRAIQLELIREHGGRPGVRDQNLLESALARPRNLMAYKDTDAFGLAAAYAYGICRNHPFIDGNKRTALMAAYVFLRMNGHILTASEVEAVSIFLRLADGSLTEKGLAEWFRLNSKTMR
jgi:death-on-curing protein